MPYFRLFLTCYCVLLALPAHSAKQAQVTHYNAMTPQSKAQAMQLYHESIGAVGYILTQQSLSNSDMEAIHEISYRLEAAIGALKKRGVLAGKDLSTLAHDIHELHEASEDHNEADIRKYFLTLHEHGDHILLTK